METTFGRAAVRARALLALLVTLVLGGCGYSEDEMRAKLREIDNLKQQLQAEQAQNAKARKELADAQATIDQLKGQLAAAGVDVANLKKDMEEQARALEDYKRRAAQLEEIRRRFELLRAKLQKLTKLGLKVVVRNQRMVIQLPGDVLFDSGRETLKKEGKEILAQVAEVVRNDGGLNARHYQVAGHTDNRPYRMGVFKDNWGLSVMRAREVLAFLVSPVEEQGGGLPEKNWSAAGYGSTDPVDSNDTPEGRQANRRCELVVLPDVSEMLDLRSLTDT
jgi:chemotaxis protein MotB